MQSKKQLQLRIVEHFLKHRYNMKHNGIIQQAAPIMKLLRRVLLSPCRRHSFVVNLLCIFTAHKYFRPVRAPCHQFPLFESSYAFHLRSYCSSNNNKNNNSTVQLKRIGENKLYRSFSTVFLLGRPSALFTVTPISKLIHTFKNKSK